MIELLATGAALASAVAFSATLAFSRHLWLAVATAGIGAGCIVAFDGPALLASAPSDTLQQALKNPHIVEAFAFAVCLEALFAAGVLWFSTSRNSASREPLLLLPLPVTAATLVAAAQASMVHGPRIDLELLGWLGLLTGLLVVASVTLAARMLLSRAADFVLELCLFLRLLAVVLAAAMVSVQLHRPAPVLSLEPAGLLAVAAGCAIIVSYGFFRRPRY